LNPNFKTKIVTDSTVRSGTQTHTWKQYRITLQSSLPHLASRQHCMSPTEVPRTDAIHALPASKGTRDRWDSLRRFPKRERTGTENLICYSRLHWPCTAISCCLSPN